MHNIGIELSALYNSNRLTLSANGTWQRVLDFEYYKKLLAETYAKNWENKPVGVEVEDDDEDEAES